MVVQIVSPDDETYEKFGFYAERGVEEILVADPTARSVTIWRRTPERSYEEASASALLGIGAAEVAAGISRPEESD